MGSPQREALVLAHIANINQQDTERHIYLYLPTEESLALFLEELQSDGNDPECSLTEQSAFNLAESACAAWQKEQTGGKRFDP